MEKLEKLKLILGLEDTIENNRLLTLLLDISEQKILDRLYPFADEVKEMPPKYEHKQIEIAAYLYNKRGAEGQTAHSENGIGRSYENADIPISMLRGITPYVGV